MQGNYSHSAHNAASLVSLGGNHGYRFEGDTAILNAELSIASSAFEGQGSQHWALQLWACETPYRGGPLHGLKVAEAELSLPPSPTLTFAGEHEHEHTRLETAAFARLPPAQGEYAMVLVLASGERGRYDQVHGFSNYSERQHFAGPRLSGSVGYRCEGDSVVLSAEAVRNTRASDNLSGSLSLELWALAAPYHGGLLHGTLLAQAALGRLEGQAEQQSLEQRVPLNQAPHGSHQLALVLTEWTDAAGWVTRDYCNFAELHHVAPALPTTDWNEPASASEAPAERADEVEAAKPAPASKASPPRVVTTQTPHGSKASAKAAPPIAAEPSTQAKLPAPRGARISLQTASVDQLASVEGLNRKLAQAIVKARPFQTLEDVVKVRGIGDKLLQKLRDQLTL